MGQQTRLHVLRQRRRDAVRIDGDIIETLGLEKDLMALAVAEAHHLILDGRAIAWAKALDVARIHRRPVKIATDQIVPRRRRPGDPAFDLRHRDTIRQAGERHRLVVRSLLVDARPIDGAPVEAGRRPGLEPSQGKAEPCKSLGETERRILPHAPGRNLALADMDKSGQKSSGGEDQRRRFPNADRRRAPTPSRGRLMPRNRDASPSTIVRRSVDLNSACMARA